MGPYRFTPAKYSVSEYPENRYQSGHKLTGLLFFHRISDFRMGGILLKNFRTFRSLCGEQTLRNVVIVTNMWGEVNPQLGEERERELSTKDDFFKPALDKGAQMMRHYNTPESAQKIVRHLLKNNPMALQIQREIVDEHRDVSQTAAAEEIERELRAEKEKQRIEAERVRCQMEGTLARSIPGKHTDEFGRGSTCTRSGTVQAARRGSSAQTGGAQ